MFACAARGRTDSEPEKSETAALTFTTKDFMKNVRFSIFTFFSPMVIPNLQGYIQKSLWESETIPSSERILLAIKDGDSTLVRRVIARGEIGELLDIRTDFDDTLLHICALHGNLEAASMICQAMIPTGQQAKFVNHRSAEGETALHTALTTNNVQVANLLLHCGADPFQQNAYHESSFYLACYSGYLDFVKIILRTRYENYLMHNRAYVHIFHTCIYST